MAINTDGLTAGRHLDGAVEDGVLHRFLRAYADRLVAMARATNRPVLQGADARLIDLRSAFHYDNAAVLLRPDADVFAVVGRARRFFSGRWVLLSAWPTADLTALGLNLVGHPPLMFRPPAPWPTPAPELLVVEVDDSSTLSDLDGTLRAGYPAPGAAGFHLEMLGTLRLFVGYLAGRPVAVAGSAVNHGVVEIDWVATLPEFRRRGFGAAMTAAAGAVADLPAVLLSSDPGHSVYLRLGFHTLLRTTIWEVP